ncbi:hypothetical protein AGOR_G00142550 [Albula goreensis]|uniref:Uncharacterized protein n=1 Tax=Albula goreensis TaxID=1534307 RepID=A0A8T3D6T6_9TELE|nr:hypothetical protein AGOR_G00142550 [Albula goreensis]
MVFPCTGQQLTSASRSPVRRRCDGVANSRKRLCCRIFTHLGVKRGPHWLGSCDSRSQWHSTSRPAACGFSRYTLTLPWFPGEGKPSHPNLTQE